jgi:hypothetical protein
MNAFVGRIDELAALAQTADAVLRGEVATGIVLGTILHVARRTAEAPPLA